MSSGAPRPNMWTFHRSCVTRVAAGSGSAERRGQHVDVVEPADLERDGADARARSCRRRGLPLAATCSRTCSYGADEPAGAERRRGRRASSTPGGDDGAKPLEAASEIALVLADERVEPERPPHRRRVAADGVARARRAPRAARGTRRGVHAQHVFHPSARSATSREQAIALAADEDARARLLPRRGQVHRVVGAVEPAVERERAAAEQAGDDLDGLGAGARCARRAAASPCRSRRTRARTNPRRARRRGARRRCGRASRAPSRAPTPGRSASHITSVPEPDVGDVARERAERDERLVATEPVGRAAVLREVEEQVVRQPHRIERRRASAARRVVDDRLEPQRVLARRPSSRTAAARARASSRGGG